MKQTSLFTVFFICVAAATSTLLKDQEQWLTFKVGMAFFIFAFICHILILLTGKACKNLCRHYRRVSTFCGFPRKLTNHRSSQSFVPIRTGNLPDGRNQVCWLDFWRVSGPSKKAKLNQAHCKYGWIFPSRR